ncbi:MAG: type 4b pilus protein PilO2 [Alphaproteobacteria bacterium]|nr:type 4b pilus protein PilO2 [Alphaproteobacteria bacterium]MDA7982794.1 type 4b pilus protein PilO2 [Alphaproteobacteria bacterium]MDA7988320.1 type 4b pilus protein PilO2 [Alphaproteobacteria bacterium]MDA8008734.1 type 4b pilus protein PilO2 [Alphaproteobacteria bacterium]MDA8030335.1 type 4b pilus protein PilO2 [Alphaproteobacteria bacterium]
MSDQTNDDDEAPGVAAEEAAPEAAAPAPAADAAPRNGVINVSGQDWAIGLSWYSFAKEILDASVKKVLGGESVYVMRRNIPGSTGNAGIGSNAMGHAAGQKVAASALAIWRGGATWLGAYPLGGGLFWIVAVIRENIIEDTAALSESEARALYKEMTTPEWGWETVYAPKDWERGGINLSEDALLRPSLTQDLRSSGARAQSLTVARPFQRMLKRHGPWAIPVILIVIGVVYFDVPGRITRLSQEEVVVAEQEIVDLPPIWDEEMLGGPWILTCARNLRPKAYYVPGWNLTRITCDAESDRIVYEYVPFLEDTGTIVEQLEVVWDDITFEREMQLGETSSFVVTPLGYAESGARGLNPIYSDVEVTAIYSEMSLLSVPVPTLGPPEETPENRFLVAENNTVEVTPPALHVPMSMVSASTPKTWYETYGLDGMVIDRVTYDGRTWFYEGRIYARQADEEG